MSKAVSGKSQDYAYLHQAASVHDFLSTSSIFRANTFVTFEDYDTDVQTLFLSFRYISRSSPRFLPWLIVL